MNRTRLTLLLAAFAVFLPVVLPADTIVEEIVARVNNDIITRSEYVRSRDQLKQEVQQQDPSQRRPSLRRQAEGRSARPDRPATASAKGQGPGDHRRHRADQEARRDAQADEPGNHGGSGEGGASAGRLVRGVQENMRNQIITQRVIGQEVGSQLAMNKEEEQKFYDEHKAEMEQPGAGSSERNSGCAEAARQT